MKMITRISTAFALLAALGCCAGQTVHSAMEDRPATNVLSFSPALSRKSLRTGEILVVWLTVKNSSDAPVYSLHVLSTEAEGAALSQLEWMSTKGQQSCDPGSFQVRVSNDSLGTRTDTSQCETQADVLLPGQSIVVRFEFDTRKSVTSGAVNATFQHLDSHKEHNASDAVLLGRIDIESRYYFVGHAVYAVIKDLALPAMLGGLALLFGRWDKRREEKREQLSKEQSNREKIEAERRELVAKTWESRLAKAMSLATEHYMPIATAVVTIQFFSRRRLEVEASNESDKSARADEYMRREFFGLMLLKKRIMNLQDKAPGFFFKNRMGERLASQAWNRFQSLYTNKMEDAILRPWIRMAGYIDLKETGDRFLSRLEYRGGDEASRRQAAEFQSGLQQFQNWVRGDRYSEGLKVLGVFRLVLAYEINRPFEYWYGSLEPMWIDDDVRQTMSGLLCESAKVVDEEEMKHLKTHLEEYIKQASSRGNTLGAEQL
jgi:hypothetical protein